MKRILGTSIAVAAVLAAPATVIAQGFVPAPTPTADALADQMRTLATSPRDVAALITAGELSVRLGDFDAANAFFARAEAIDPRNPRLMAGRAAMLVQLERPGEALRLWDAAERSGASITPYLASRGLAWDLVGQPAAAQRDYRRALLTDRDDETVRRLALSLGISGQDGEALTLLDPLLRRGDRAAWRARAFVLAMAGQQAEAERIAAGSVVGGAQMGPFLAMLRTLAPADRSFAVHFGSPSATPLRTADARLAPVPTGGVALAVTTPPMPPVTRAAAPPIVVAPPRTAPSVAATRTATPIPTAPPQPVRSLSGSIARPLPQPLASGAVSLAQRTPLPQAASQTAAPEVASAQPAATPGSAAAPLQPVAPGSGSIVALTHTRPTPTTVAGFVSPPITPVIGSSVAPAQPPAAPTVAASPTTPPITPALGSGVAVASPLPGATIAGSVAPPPITPAPEVAATGAQSSAVPTASASLITTPVAPTPGSVVSTVGPLSARTAGSGAATAPGMPNAASAVAAAEALPLPGTDRETPAMSQPLSNAPVATAPVIVTAAAPDAPPSPPVAATVPVAESTAVAPAQSNPATEIVAPAVANWTLAPRASPAPAPAPQPATVRTPEVARRNTQLLAAVISGIDVPAAELGVAPPAKPVAAVSAKAVAKAPAKPKPEPKKSDLAKEHPQRWWVQVAGGANEADLGKEWKRVSAKAPSAFRGKSAWTTPLKATNRLLAGPFASQDAAMGFVNALKKDDVSSFAWQSAAGQAIDKLETR